MNIFTVLALIISSFNLIYTIQVNLGVLHYENADNLNKDVVDRVDRYYQRQGKRPRVNFLQETISDTSILSANHTICQLTVTGLLGLIGPTASPVAPIVESVCSNLEIPHVQYSWTSMPAVINMSINFYPESELLAKGIGALVSAMHWKSFTILYESPYALVRLKEVLKITVPADAPIMVKQISPGADYRPIFKEIRKLMDNTIIIDCALESIIPILTHAKEVRMLEMNNKFFLANLDAHTLNFSLFEGTAANVTTIRLLNTSSPKLINVVKDWNDGRVHHIQPEEARVEQVILSDAINFFMKRFYELTLVDRERIHAPKPLFCNGQHTTEHGFRLHKYALTKADHMISGPIEFDSNGRRVDFQLFSVELTHNTKEVIADWRPFMGANVEVYRNYSSQMEAAIKNLQKVTVKVASKIGAPYLRSRKAPPGEKYEGNEAVEGFSFDLIDAISKIQNFTFEFTLYEETGKFDPVTKTYNGLIGELISRRAHLAICDLTITEERRSVVDFSLPFMNLGISILHSRPKVTEESKLFAFMDPFDFEVWLYTVTLYLIVSSVLYIICRFAPGDWENPHPCDPQPEELENMWGLKNCFWLTLGSIMTQGCDILPKGISSRMGTSMWWFFSLIMTSSYTANLAAFLTKERMGTTISSAEDLAKQTKIKYGTVLNGATMAFFKNSNFSTYARLWTNMEQAKPSVFEKSNDDGVKRVLSARGQMYAFFMESSTIEYEKVKNCNLRQVGGRLDSKGYGIAMPMGADYRSAIDQAILKLQETGKIRDLKEKWWKDKVPKDVECDDDENKEGEPSPELGLDNVGGMFIVLAVGVAIAFVLAFVEFLWNVQQVAVEEHITYCAALVLELKFAVKVWITQKRAKPVLSESSSNVSDTRSIAMRVMQTASSFINLDVFDRVSNTQRE